MSVASLVGVLKVQYTEILRVILNMAHTVPVNEVVVPSVDLVVPPLPGGVGHAGAEPRRELPHEVVVEAVLQRPQDDDGPGELEVDLLDGLVGQDGRAARARGREAVAAPANRNEKL